MTHLTGWEVLRRWEKMPSVRCGWCGEYINGTRYDMEQHRKFKCMK